MGLSFVDDLISCNQSYWRFSSRSCSSLLKTKMYRKEILTQKLGTDWEWWYCLCVSMCMFQILLCGFFVIPMWCSVKGGLFVSDMLMNGIMIIDYLKSRWTSLGISLPSCRKFRHIWTMETTLQFACFLSKKEKKTMQHIFNF